LDLFFPADFQILIAFRSIAPNRPPFVISHRSALCPSDGLQERPSGGRRLRDIGAATAEELAVSKGYAKSKSKKKEKERKKKGKLRGIHV
jgi:hypothetical protein